METAKRRQAGYTVIELSLFLGISALLFMVAIFATGSTIRNTRFTDSGRSLEAFVQKQYDDILNGVNPRTGEFSCSDGVIGSGSQDPGTSNCLLIGKLLLFQTDSPNIATYDIVAADPGIDVDFGKTDEQLIAQDYRPRVVTGVNTANYTITWQAPIIGIERTSDSQATNALALIRSPRSQRIIAYSYKEGASPTNNLLQTVVENAATNGSKTVNFCIRSADGFGAPARLEVGPGSNQSAARIVFDASTGDCNGT